jgi:hypothetical protein
MLRFVHLKPPTRSSLNITLKFLSTNKSLDLQHRDVFVSDPSFSLKAWDILHEKGLSTKHPSSGHILAKYLSHMFNHSKYHFNNLGEFSMNITSAIPVTSKDIFIEKETSTNDKIEVAEVLQNENAHRVLIHPDGLSISGLTILEVPTLMDLLMKEELITAAFIAEILPTCTIEVLPMTIVVSSNTSSTAAKEVLGWFDKALKASAVNMTLAPKMDNFILLLASEMGGHRNASSVLILPYEDSFELVSSSERAATIIAKYNIEEV